METRHKTIESLLRALQPKQPVYCIYRHIYRDAAQHFVTNFPGRVLYAVKANNHPLVIESLGKAGVEHYDCASLQEVELVKSLFPEATCYLMNPVRLDGDARTAQGTFGIRHFMIDHAAGLAPLLGEIDASRSIVFARMAVSHHSAMADLSTKFGAPPADMPAILQLIEKAGAVLLRKEDRLYLNDGMYGAFWELRFKGHVRYPARAYRGHQLLAGNLRSFRLFGPTCDSSDEMPGSVELPANIDVGDYIEFGSMGAYSLSGRTTFNGFYSDDVVTIESESCLPPG